MARAAMPQPTARRRTPLLSLLALGLAAAALFPGAPVGARAASAWSRWLLGRGGAAGGASGDQGGPSFVLWRREREPEPPPPPPPPSRWSPAELKRRLREQFGGAGGGQAGGKAKVLGLLALCSIAAAVAYEARRAIDRSRELKRPYELWESLVGHVVDAGDLCRIVAFLQDTVVVPIDERLPGRPFEYDLHSFPFTPMVLVIGNHSSGKSTFINQLLGISVQETGVAPTDDGFTVLERRQTDSTEDGPTVLGCPENRPFRELQRFGQAFSGHFRRKRKALPEDSAMPFGLQLVDTPGMIDLPAQGISGLTENSVRGRGYNFVDVVRWWAKRADLVLLLFDPDKPGTTGETLEVLTKSLAGLNHKFLVVLNKVDQLDNSVDFARAYGALGWALSKVIRRKDIPQIYTMYNAGFDSESRGGHKLPLEAFAKRREEVIAEVLRARERHFDNVVTSLEETLRQVAMVATVMGVIRSRAILRRVLVWLCILVVLVAPAVAYFLLLATEQLPLPNASLAFGLSASYILVYIGVTAFLREYTRQFCRLQATSLNDTFEETYADFFIHNDGEDYRSRWQVVRPKIGSILSSVACASMLGAFPQWEVARIDTVLQKDIWYLRQLARILRLGPDANSSAEGAAKLGVPAAKRRGGEYSRAATLGAV